MSTKITHANCLNYIVAHMLDKTTIDPLFPRKLSNGDFYIFSMGYAYAELTRHMNSSALGSLKFNEKNLIQQALQDYNGNRRKASKSLGISERTLYRKIKTYNL